MLTYYTYTYINDQIILEGIVNKDKICINSLLYAIDVYQLEM